jgi:hypothetical protein
MNQLASSDKPALKPDVYCYNIVMNAWSKTRHTDSGMRMWMLYEQMKKDNVAADSTTYTTLISFFAVSKDQIQLQRATFLLQCMEENEQPELRPDFRHFVPIIKGWLSTGNVDTATKVLMRFANTSNSAVYPHPSIIDMVMHQWLQVGDLETATSLIYKFGELKDANDLPKGPHSQSYKSLLEAWNMSKHPEKSVNIQKLQNGLATLEQRLLQVRQVLSLVPVNSRGGLNEES